LPPGGGGGGAVQANSSSDTADDDFLMDMGLNLSSFADFTFEYLFFSSLSVRVCACVCVAEPQRRSAAEHGDQFVEAALAVFATAAAVSSPRLYDNILFLDYLLLIDIFPV